MQEIKEPRQDMKYKRSCLGNAVMEKFFCLLRPQRGQYLLTPGKGTEGSSSHHDYRQPLKVAVFFCLLTLATRKRVHILFE